MNIIEVLRRNSLESIFSTNTVRGSWPIWSEGFKELLGENPKAEDLLNLGNNLSAIFTSTGGVMMSR